MLAYEQTLKRKNKAFLRKSWYTIPKHRERHTNTHITSQSVSTPCPHTESWGNRDCKSLLWVMLSILLPPVLLHYFPPISVMLVGIEEGKNEMGYWNKEILKIDMLGKTEHEATALDRKKIRILNSLYQCTLNSGQLMCTAILSFNFHLMSC